MTDQARSPRSHAQQLVEIRHGRDLVELLQELYVTQRHSQEAIARALDISRPTVSVWLREFQITRPHLAVVIEQQSTGGAT